MLCCVFLITTIARHYSHVLYLAGDQTGQDTFANIQLRDFLCFDFFPQNFATATAAIYILHIVFAALYFQFMIQTGLKIAD